MKDTRARLVFPLARLVLSKNRERERIHINPSELCLSVRPRMHVLTYHRRTATLEDRMHHLETMIQSIPPGVFAAVSAMSGDSSAPQFSLDPTASPLASFASSTHTYPAGVPPPSLHVFPLLNPSTHFTTAHTASGSRSGARSPTSAFQSVFGHYPGAPDSPTDDLAENTSRMSLSPSYLYFDDEGYTRWQGETSGLPLLDLLVENYIPTTKNETLDTNHPDLSLPGADKSAKATNTNWFPNRTPRRTDVNPGNLWRLITSCIAPDLMDRCIRIT
jgi:hypothetical protein